MTTAVDTLITTHDPEGFADRTTVVRAVGHRCRFTDWNRLPQLGTFRGYLPDGWVAIEQHGEILELHRSEVTVTSYHHERLT